MSRHADVMDADGFWRQFMTVFYFDTPGQEVSGTLLAYRKDGAGVDAVPVIRLQTKEGRVHEITAHQERLKAELVKAAPAKGDLVRIRYDGEAERAAPGMSKAKLFTVTLRRRGSQSPGRTSGETALGEVAGENTPGTET